ncbi:hypothetical protein [Paenibacillus sp. 1_12]|uniref:hypothetical protein n=1 Tax=Paenibacillus sp. 1_12 TaxID=1566278 RepID=UPI0011603433|nr:hypothetical protein [Paenibacillus sp. 1_12]
MVDLGSLTSLRDTLNGGVKVEGVASSLRDSLGFRGLPYGTAIGGIFGRTAGLIHRTFMAASLFGHAQLGLNNLVSLARLGSAVWRDFVFKTQRDLFTGLLGVCPADRFG